MIFFGDNLENMLMQAKASCRKCGTEFTFEEGGLYAKDNGIDDQVVMCKKCNSVYKVQLTPGRMTLLADVTDVYHIDK